jgi:hypothetical protein
MAVSLDPMTCSTRRAANAAALSVVVYAVLWVVTTQIDVVRTVSPLAEDPWDAVASYAAIFLPVVAGATWTRSLRHRGPVLEAAAGRRIRWGAGLAAAIVLAASGADLAGIAATGFPPDAGTIGPLIASLVAVALASSAVAIVLGMRAARAAPNDPVADAGAEPDIVEDLLALAADVSRPIGLGDRVERIGVALDAILDRSPWSPRRHRLGFGLVVAVAAGVAFSAWHALREGPPEAPGVLVILAALMGSGVLAIYLATVGPLRLLRPPAS